MSLINFFILTTGVIYKTLRLFTPIVVNPYLFLVGLNYIVNELNFPEALFLPSRFVSIYFICLSLWLSVTLLFSLVDTLFDNTVEEIRKKD